MQTKTMPGTVYFRPVVAGLRQVTSVEKQDRCENDDTDECQAEIPLSSCRFAMKYGYGESAKESDGGHNDQ